MSILIGNPSRRRGSSAGGGLIIQLQKMMLVSCQDIVTLDATLIGTPIGPQTYNWVQLSGSPVTWLEPQNQASSTFQQPSNRNDKVFRFWLDQGTRWQQYADITITSVALDTFSQPPAIAPIFVRTGLATQIVKPPYSIEPAPTDNQLGVVVLNNTERMVVFQPVTDTQFVSHYQLNKLQIGSTTEEQHIPFKVNYFRGLELGSVYRIDTVLNNNGFISQLKGSVVTAVLPANNELAVMEKSPIHVANVTRGINFTKNTISRELETLAPDNNDTMTGAFSCLGIAMTKAVISRSLETAPVVLDTMTGGFKNRGIHFTMTVTQSAYSSIG
jgi:hypothetical protein